MIFPWGGGVFCSKAHQIQVRNVIGSQKNTVSSPSLLPPDWKDAWLSIPGNTHENGKTYDGRINKLISNPSYHSRFDRMFTRMEKWYPVVS